jgi:ubiquinone/menaquinone biosynthesis C-methylase UbiE
MPDVPYTHGHHDSVLRSHRWRTAENSAAYLLPHLRPGLDLLDVGCGPGTITVDLAGRVAPGTVVGLDAAAEVIAEATARVDPESTPNVSFRVGDVFALPFEDGSFDVVHAHQVLQHVGDPVAALSEMRRVCRPGGLVAARDGDYPAISQYPADPVLDAAQAAYRAAATANGGHTDAARRLLAWAHRAGFATVVPSASVWCYATPEERRWWGDLWADRFTVSSLAEQLVARGLATPADLESFGGAWRRWAADPDGWYAILHGEVLCTP